MLASLFDFKSVALQGDWYIYRTDLLGTEDCVRTYPAYSPQLPRKRLIGTIDKLRCYAASSTSACDHLDATQPLSVLAVGCGSGHSRQ
jgi:hypothetical protein